MRDDVIINKVQTIERCINRIKEEYQDKPENLKNYTKQDSIILNIQRACEACIDIAMHIVSEKGWGVPQKTREAFDILNKNSVIEDDFVDSLKAMVGFRNIAVHDYQNINLEIIKKIIEIHLNDFLKFTKLVISY